MSEDPVSKRIIPEKLARVRAGAPMRTLDLFSGCGGIALGFLAAGFHTIGSVELDPDASKSFATNFLRGPIGDQASLAAPKDITALEPEATLRMIGVESPVEASVDILVGGPPCQAFARIGRAKLREVAAHPEAFRQDPRGNLYLRYLAYVRALKPLAILVENVPDVLNYGGHNVPREICECLEEEGYECRYTLLNSVYYGVPQMRERMFLVAVHQACQSRFEFPVPTHSCMLPEGYGHSRRIATKYIQASSGSLGLLDLEDPYFTPPPFAPAGLADAVSAGEALGDLPWMNPSEVLASSQSRPRPKPFTEAMPYAAPPQNGFQHLMRSWPGFEAREGGVADHVIRHLPRDFHFFSAMPPGCQYPELHAYAEKWFREVKLPSLRAKNHPIPAPDSEEYATFKARFVPPYDPGKFPNKWRKMEQDKPSRTLLAHLGKDSYSHIHYDSGQGRTISVREAARLQSFPDGFVFEGAMNAAFRQIGNAVPPLMSYAIAMSLRSAIGIQPIRDIRERVWQRLEALDQEHRTGSG